ncbi:MAG: ABC transporter substrate-binding protein [Treponema sp.]|jgi:NitT/TauT family transport system substrate-binding protein|nr:ABC transporter substrate-binding protein [Treponema sp.]
MKTRKQEIWLPVIITALLSLSLMTGCDKSKEQTGATLPSLKIGLIVQDAVRPALVVTAEQLGYYQEEGVKVEFVPVDSVRSGLAAVQTRKIDVFPFSANALSSIAKGSNDVIIGGVAVEGSSLVVSKNNFNVDFKDFRNWQGKTIGADPATANIYLLQEYIRSVYPDWKQEDVNWLPFDDNNVLLEAIRKGTVDGGFLTTERVWLAEESGLKEAFDLAEYLPYYLCCRLTADLNGVRENRAAYVALLRAQLRAEHDYKADTKKIIDAVVEYTEQREQYVVRYIASEKNFDGGGLVNFKNPVSPDPLFNKIEELNRVNIALGNYQMAEGVNLKEHVDLSIYQEAIEDLLDRYPNDIVYQKAYELFQKNNSRYFDS